MIMRLLGSLTLWTLILVVGVGYGLQSVTTDEIAAKRNESDDELILVNDDDDDDDSDDGFTSGADSNDGTGSGYSAASRDGELSRGDRTRDWTGDGTANWTRDNSRNATDDGSRNDSRASQDGTGSGYTAVSADRDRSRGDKSRDWTRDGQGDRTRDFSQNRTNDRSRGDTR